MATIDDVGLRRVRLLTMAETGALLGLGRTSLYHLTQRVGDPMPTVKMGRSVRVPLLALEAWLDRQGGRR